MVLPVIRDSSSLFSLVEEIGLLPFFKCGISGFSLEECVPDELWFKKGIIGPWEWREQILNRGGMVYSKLFNFKAGYCSLDIYPHLCNFRRSGYDFDSLYEEGKASRGLKLIYDTVVENRSITTSELNSLKVIKNPERYILYLLMQTYLTIESFDYKTDKNGKPYGWGISRFTASEILYGGSLVRREYRTDPAESLRLLCGRISSLFPYAPEASVCRLLNL